MSLFSEKEQKEQNPSIVRLPKRDSHSHLMYPKWQEINDILKNSHDLLSKVTKTSISWIRGHADIEGNEISDKAAKEGALRKDQPLSTSYNIQVKWKIWQMT